MSELRNKIIRLAYEKPELRKHLLPLVKEAREEVYWCDPDKGGCGDNIQGRELKKVLAEAKRRSRDPRYKGYEFECEWCGSYNTIVKMPEWAKWRALDPSVGSGGP